MVIYMTDMGTEDMTLIPIHPPGIETGSRSGLLPARGLVLRGKGYTDLRRDASTPVARYKLAELTARRQLYGLVKPCCAHNHACMTRTHRCQHAIAMSFTDLWPVLDKEDRCQRPVAPVVWLYTPEMSSVGSTGA